MLNDPAEAPPPTSSSTSNVVAWILCAPACFALAALNLLPAGRALVAGPPMPLGAELTGWIAAVLSIGAGALATTGVILAVETPLAIGTAIALLRRYPPQTPGQRPTPRWLLSAVVAGFCWRLIFGGGIGFTPLASPSWPSYALEVWRTLPLAALLFYIVLYRAGAHLAEFAALDGAGPLQTIRLVYLPICAPAVFLLAGLRIVDYLRVLDAGVLQPGSNTRAVWTLLFLAVGALTLRVAETRRLGPESVR